MISFEVLDDTEPDYIKVRLINEDWIIDFHLSYLDYEYGDFNLWGDDPVYQYVGELDYFPKFDLDDDMLGDMILTAKWK